jgi:hypothetical protein
MSTKLLARIGLLMVAAGTLLTVLLFASRAAHSTIRGVVLNGAAPVVGAIVRVQGTTTFAVSDENGNFELAVERGAHVTAWAPGYHISAAQDTALERITIQLRKHPITDNPDYAFISPSTDSGSSSACGRCHAAQPGSQIISLPVDEWQQDAHSQAAVNPRFLSVYNGTTLDGEPGNPTVYRFDQDSLLNVPVAPSLGQESASVGYRLDFPDQAGPCAACHVPVSALLTPYNADPNEAEGVAREGITCDFCHKLWDVRLGEDGLPHPNLPGVLSIEMLRPAEGKQVFLGPFDDTPGDDIYSPIQNESRFCAACHTGTFWGVTMYNSFGEWLDSSYSDRTTGKTCQDCHMPHLGVDRFVQLPSDVTQFVPERNPQTIFSHRMPGASDVGLLQNSVKLALNASIDADSVTATVRVTNANAGHHVPTDNPLRNMILLVEAHNAQGQPLTFLDGPTIPSWGGVGDPKTGHYAGLPGVLYAKMLADFYTGETPTFAYWRQTRLVSDNRIAALASDASTYHFRLPRNGAVTVEARLLFRRAFIELMDEKGWDTPDILMEQERVTVAR